MENDISVLEEMIRRLQIQLFHIGLLQPIVGRYFPNGGRASQSHESREKLLEELSSASPQFVETLRARLSDPVLPSEISSVTCEFDSAYYQNSHNLSSNFGLILPGLGHRPTYISYREGERVEVQSASGEFLLRFFGTTNGFEFLHSDLRQAFFSAFHNTSPERTHVVQFKRPPEKLPYSVLRIDDDTAFLQLGYYEIPPPSGNFWRYHDIVSNSPNLAARLLAHYYQSQGALPLVLDRAHQVTGIPKESNELHW